jgi:hypothetical protein
MLITVAVLDGPAEMPTSSSFTLIGTGAADGPALLTSSSFILFPTMSAFCFTSAVATLFDELQVEAGECCHHRRVLVLCFEAIAGLLAWLPRGAASAGNGRQRWPVRRSGHLGSVGVAVVAAGSVNGRQRWRRERGGEDEEAGTVNMQWGRNLFTPPPLRGVKIGAGNRDK